MNIIIQNKLNIYKHRYSSKKSYPKINEIYTDGSIQNRNMGVGIWSNDDLCLSYKLKGMVDTNRAELGAITIALLMNTNKNVIKTDSRTSLSVIKNNNDCPKFYILKKCIQFLSNKDMSFLKVKGHSGILGNESADFLADYAVNNNVDTFILPDDICTYEEINNIDITDIILTVKKMNNI